MVRECLGGAETGSMEYPSSNIGVASSRSANMTTDPVHMNILLAKFFTDGKFNGDYRQFGKEIRFIKNPMQALRMCCMGGERKKLASEAKKVLKKLDTSIENS